MLRRVVLLAALAGLVAAGCGDDGAEPDGGSAASPEAPEQQGEQTPGEPSRVSASPGLTVRTFLDRYAAADATRACELVAPAFANPHSQGRRGPEACQAGGEDDILTQPLEIVASDTGSSAARVLALNPNRTQLLFSLEVGEEGWRIAEVQALGTLPEGREPRLPGK